MTERKYKCSVNPDLIDKNIKNDVRLYKTGFQNFEWKAQKLINAVQTGGFAISYQYQGDPPTRSSDNFLCTDFVAVDVDGNRTIDNALADPLVKNNALFIYTTVHHTPDDHRYRIVFGLPRTIIDRSDIKSLATGLALRLCGDVAAVDAARIFFGSKGCQVIKIGNEALSADLFTDLIKQGLDQINSRRKSKNSVEALSHSSSTPLLPDDLLTDDSGKRITLGSITVKTNVLCPDHFDKKPSAFVDINEKGNRYLWCSVCLHTRWESYQSGDYEFNLFDQAIKQVSSRNGERRTVTTQMGDVSTPYIQSSRIRITSDQKLKIDDLHKQSVMFIKSPKGSGKTTILPNIMGPHLSLAVGGVLTFDDVNDADDEGPPPRLDGQSDFSVLLIGHRRSLIREMTKRLNLNCYLDDDSKEVGYQVNKQQRIYDRQKRYGICLDSLPKIKRDAYRLIIIDESEQVLSHFLSSTLKSREYIFRRFEKLLRNSSTIICLDADMSWLTFNTICELAPSKSYDLSVSKRTNDPDMYSKSVWIYLNEFKQTDREISIYNNKDHLLGEVIESLRNDRRVFITSNSKNLVIKLNQSISNVLPTKRTFIITSDNSSTKESQEFIQDITIEFLNYDAVLTSPTLSTGIDITFKNDAKNVDVVYGFFENDITHHFEIDQQISRVRHPKEIKVWISSRRMNYELDVAIVKDDILRNNLLANVASHEDAVTFAETIERDDKFLRLATIVEERSRASMNKLKNNFIDYKAQQGFKINLIENDDEISKYSRLQWGYAESVVHHKQRQAILDAPYIDSLSWWKIHDMKDSNLEISSDQRHGYIKSKIEFFFRQPINMDDLNNYFDKYIGKIRLFEHLNFINEALLRGNSTDTAVPSNTLALDAEVKNTIITIHDKTHIASLSSIDDFKTSVVLLHLLLEKTPIYDLNGFKVDVKLSKDDLDEFLAFANEHKTIIEKQLCKVNNLKHEKVWIPQLNLFLGLIGLSLKKEKSKWSNGKKTYLYSLDQDLLQRNQEIIKRRKQFSDHEYSAIYWKQLHKENDFQTPVMLKVNDETGVHLMPISDLEERFTSTHMESTQNTDHVLLTKLVNED